MSLNIAILGVGRVGGALGQRWAQLGNKVIFGSRNPNSDRVRTATAEAGANACAATVAEAVRSGDVVVLAAPWSAAKGVLDAAGDLSGKILIDCTNPVTSDFRSLAIGHTDSAAEQIAAWVPGARVVKAFNTVSAGAMANPNFNGEPAAMMYCGDDNDAKAVVHRLAESLGFAPLDAGPLVNARYLEPFAMLYIQLAIKHGWGSNCGFKVLQR